MRDPVSTYWIEGPLFQLTSAATVCTYQANQPRGDLWWNAWELGELTKPISSWEIVYQDRTIWNKLLEVMWASMEEVTLPSVTCERITLSLVSASPFAFDDFTYLHLNSLGKSNKAFGSRQELRVRIPGQDLSQRHSSAFWKRPCFIACSWWLGTASRKCCFTASELTRNHTWESLGKLICFQNRPSRSCNMIRACP